VKDILIQSPETNFVSAENSLQIAKQSAQDVYYTLPILLSD